MKINALNEIMALLKEADSSGRMSKSVWLDAVHLKKIDGAECSDAGCIGCPYMGVDKETRIAQCTHYNKPGACDMERCPIQ